MNILIAEDDSDTGSSYKRALEDSNHKVILTENGEECLKIYHEKLGDIKYNTSATEHIQPFDVVILDYKMPKINGMEVAKEILAINPHQRIIFASAYVKETLEDSLKQLRQVVELMQKPFAPNALIDTVEDKEIYDELKRFNVNVEFVKAANFRHEQLREILEALRRLQKRRTF
ncbi:MAG TPA: response regulator [Nitrososphaeraceae archaeon]|nr:response regulator [Nitrososphaeraceae archaeon]